MCVRGGVGCGAGGVAGALPPSNQEQLQQRQATEPEQVASFFSWRGRPSNFQTHMTPPDPRWAWPLLIPLSITKILKLVSISIIEAIDT